MRDHAVRESATEFAARLRARFPDADVAVALPRGEVTITTAGDWIDAARALRDEFGFESLIDLCGVDYLGHGSDEWDTDRCVIGRFQPWRRRSWPGPFQVR